MQVERVTDGFSFRELLNSLSGRWKKPLVAGVFAGLIVTAVFTMLRFNWPSYTNYSSAIYFNFEGVEQGRYPNETYFSISDLTSTEVLQEVYKVNNLASRQLKFDDFVAQVSARPRFGHTVELQRRLRERLAAPGVTFAERDRLETEFRNSIVAQSQRSADIIFVVRSMQAISAELALKVIHDIPRVWARQSVEIRGVQRLPSFNVPAAFSYPAGKSFDEPLLKLVFLQDQATQLGLSLNQFKKIQSAWSGTPRRDGVSLASLELQLQAFQGYTIAPLLKVAATAATPQVRALGQIGIDARLNSLKSILSVLEQTEEAYRRGSEQIIAFAGRATTERVSSPLSTRGDTNVTFSDAGALGRILELRDQAALSRLQEAMVRGRVNALSERSPYLMAINNFTDMLQLMNDAGRVEKADTDLTSELSRVEASFIEMNDRFREITEMTLRQRVMAGGEMYVPVASDRDTEFVSPVRSQTIVLAGLTMFISVFITLWFGSALREIFHQR